MTLNKTENKPEVILDHR